MNTGGHNRSIIDRMAANSVKKVVYDNQTIRFLLRIPSPVTAVNGSESGSERSRMTKHRL